jgi:hypothetical protein
MEVFIDKGFIDDFVHELQNQPDDDILAEVSVFLSRLTGVRIYCNISPAELIENVIYRKLTNAGETIPRYEPQLFEKMSERQEFGVSTYKLFFMSIYFDSSAVSGYIVFTLNNIKKLWSTYSEKRQDLQIPIATDFAQQLLGWSFLNTCQHPLRTIVISDRYMFKSIERVYDNLLPLLKKLMKLTASNHQYEVEVLLIGLFQDNANSFPIVEIYETLHYHLKKRAKIFLVEITPPLHSRAVVTSNWFINPDTSLDFIRNGKVATGADGNLYHGFLYNTSKIRLAKQFLKNIRQKIQTGRVTFYDPQSNTIRVGKNALPLISLRLEND